MRYRITKGYILRKYICPFMGGRCYGSPNGCPGLASGSSGCAYTRE